MTASTSLSGASHAGSAAVLADYYRKTGQDSDEYFADLAAEYIAADRELEADRDR